MYCSIREAAGWGIATRMFSDLRSQYIVSTCQQGYGLGRTGVNIPAFAV